MHIIALCRTALCHALTSLVFALSASLCLCPIASANDEAIAETSVIDSREEELRRKEQELLRSIDLNSTTVPAASVAPHDAPSSSPNLADAAPAVVLEVKAPEEPVVVEPLGQMQPAQARPEKPTALAELTRHPALEPPKKIPAAPPVLPNRVRTKSYDEFPDGTTAKRLGSFYRIDRGGEYTNAVGGVARARTVPIQDMSPTNTGRPALLTSDELATIRNSSTYLRTGPTRLDSALLKVPQYAEVIIDYRSGAWYRVRTENGVRGWVPGSSLLFDANIPPHSTIRIGGVR